MGAYKGLVLDKTEYATLCWLADHGYDGDLLKLAGVAEETEDGGAVLGDMAEHVAWEYASYVEEDPDAFLSCNGSASLAEKMTTLLDSIV